SGECSQCKKERGASFDFRLRPDLPSVFVNNALHRGQAYAGAFEIFAAMQALEHAEELIGMLHVEADAVIAHENRGPAVDLLVTNLNYCRIARPRILGGVGEEVI